MARAEPDTSLFTLKRKAARPASAARADGHSGAIPLETAPAPLESRPRIGLNLFWRTFFMLALLLVGSTVAWLQTFRALEYEPRAILAAQQVASLVNLSRAALIHSDAIARVSLIKTLADQEALRILPREPGDRWDPFTQNDLDQRISDELARRLGPGTVVASRVNGTEGLWVGFLIERDSYWLQVDRSRVSPLGSKTWMIWLVVAAALSLTGAAIIARLINQPLKQLSFAASRVRGGDFDASHLDEKVATSEIREVNIGFNRMAEQLAKIEQDRAVMLAGISHDLRTPLARLRLETEMSVADEEAREHMVADIAQLDAIIDKFLDYARPGHGADRRLSGRGGGGLRLPVPDTRTTSPCAPTCTRTCACWPTRWSWHACCPTCWRTPGATASRRDGHGGGGNRRAPARGLGADQGARPRYRRVARRRWTT
jgi:two-component system osmolarity sensor histidine kinase EnvZ